MVRQCAAGVPPDGRLAVRRAARTDRPQVVHGRGQRAATDRLVRVMEGDHRVRAVRVVRGARSEHGPERGTGAHVRRRDRGATAPGPAVLGVHVHHHAGLFRGVPHVYGSAVAHHRHGQHDRTHRVFCSRRSSGECFCCNI